MADAYPIDAPILLVDDEPSWLMTIEVMLSRKAGIDEVTCLSDSREVMEVLAQQEFALVLLDYTMPHLSGEDLLKMISRDYPDLPVIVLTGRDQVDTAVACMRAGAVDYFIKSHEEDRLVAAIRRVLSLRQQKRENERLKKGLLGGRLEHPQAFAALVHEGPQIESLCHYVEAIAEGRAPVLIEGESGTGKEILAKAMHKVSGAEGEWVAVNLSGLSDDQFAASLFGHVAGGLPGVERSRRGLIEQAASGTLFLDEVGTLSENCQLNLLRVLQDGQFYPVGSDEPRQASARFVVSSNQRLSQLVDEGQFRKDLYYRLQGYRLEVPPLRERMEDIPLLLDHFLQQAADELGKRKPTPPPELQVLLQSYHFPGNVRELRNMVFDAVSRHTSRKLSMDAFRKAMGRDEVRGGGSDPAGEDEVVFGERLPTIKALTQRLVLESLERAQGNQSVMAEMLGISRPALNKRLKILREEGVVD